MLNIINHLLLFGHSFMSDSLQPHGHRLPCPPLSPGLCSNSHPLSQWCSPTIPSSVTPCSSCPHSFPASGSFSVSQLFLSGGQSIGASALALLLPVNIQDWFPLGWTRLISLQPKGLLRVCSRDLPGGPVTKTLCSQSRGPGFDPGQGTRSHMPQLRPSAAK